MKPIFRITHLSPDCPKHSLQEACRIVIEAAVENFRGDSPIDDRTGFLLAIPGFELTQRLEDDRNRYPSLSCGRDY